MADDRNPPLIRREGGPEPEPQGVAAKVEHEPPPAAEPARRPGRDEHDDGGHDAQRAELLGGRRDVVEPVHAQGVRPDLGAAVAGREHGLVEHE